MCVCITDYLEGQSEDQRGAILLRVYNSTTNSAALHVSAAQLGLQLPSLTTYQELEQLGRTLWRSTVRLRHAWPLSTKPGGQFARHSPVTHCVYEGSEHNPVAALTGNTTLLHELESTRSGVVMLGGQGTVDTQSELSVASGCI